MPEMTQAEALAFKRDLKQMRDKYEPKWVESHWYDYWCQKKYFHADANKAIQQKDKRFTMLVPPPNVTGSLHIGHGLTFAIEDSLARFYRMNGYVTEYTPGTDHAGISTQTVVEKQIWKKEQKTRYDYGRDAFLQKVWEWKKSYGERILMQSKRLGASVDWDRLFFTMDKNLSIAVKEAFVRLYDKGLIYRANRLVNWSCKAKTALSDIEVEKIDLTGRTLIQVPNHTEKVPFGVITSFAYKLVDSDDEMVIATTRLETMLGDVAVAVHPNDERYKKFHNKELQHPFLDRKIKVITDDKLVDMNFGTGCVKITPAHDQNDFECGQRHSLPMIQIFNDDGLMNHNCGQFEGMKRFECRAKLLALMKERDIFRGDQDNPMVLGICTRSKDVIEPMLRPQWYVNCQDIAKTLIDKVETKELQIIPEEHEKKWNEWMTGIRDWCISRQIWWGHQCPAYYASFPEDAQDANKEERSDRWVIARSMEEAQEKAKALFSRDDFTLTQDEDVLDTWFSSGLLPFSAFEWPNCESKDFEAFFPNSVLETGSDILFFWVARMAMFSELLCGKLPFKTVLLHPIIRDAQGRKMSKSLGNVIDPLEIIDGCTLKALQDKILEGNLEKSEQGRSLKEKETEFPTGIPECGADALRFSLLCYLTQSRSINLDLKRIIGYRNFCNKIWQSYKFVALHFEGITFKESAIDFQRSNLINRWILVKLNTLKKNMQEHFRNFQMADASNGFHSFWIHDFCDQYIESTKFIFQGNDEALKAETKMVLFHVIEAGMRLLHPMMPFITEELYQKMPDFEGKFESLCIGAYPLYNPEWDQISQIQLFEAFQGMSKKCRQLCSSVSLPQKVKPEIFFMTENAEYKKDEYKSLLVGLTKASQISFVDSREAVPKGCVVGVFQDMSIFISVKDHIDIEKEIQKSENKLKQVMKQIETARNKMSIKDYESKTPEEIKQANQQKLDALNLDREAIEHQIADLKNL